MLVIAQVINVGDQTWYVKWQTLGNADNGSAVQFGQFPDRTIQAVGTFGGATVTLEGSMDSTTWATLRDFQGNSVTLTDSSVRLIAECPLYVRVRTSGGSGTNLDAYISGSRA